MTQNWDNAPEKEFKETIKNYFDNKINKIRSYPVDL